MKAISLFTGAGGMDLGFEAAGIDIIWANEFNADAVKTYQANHPDTKVVHEDIRKAKNIWDYEYYDIIKHEQVVALKEINDLCIQWMDTLQRVYIDVYDILFDNKKYQLKDKYIYKNHASLFVLLPSPDSANTISPGSSKLFEETKSLS